MHQHILSRRQMVKINIKKLHAKPTRYCCFFTAAALAGYIMNYTKDPIKMIFSS
jgi:hypothetical protein